MASEADDADSTTMESTNLVQPKDHSCQVLTVAEFRMILEEKIETLTWEIPISHSAASILLNYFKWNEECVIKNFRDDCEELFKRVGILNTVRAYTQEERKNNSLKKECGICFISLEDVESFTLGCDHIFCITCWAYYLKEKILSVGMSNNITCAELDCNILVDERSCLSMLQDPIVRSSYEKLMISNLVESFPLSKFCPNEECQKVIVAKELVMKPIICACGTTICIKCGKIWHSPVTCEVLEKWDEKMSYNINQLWLEENCKPCPKCRVPIEKRGGCRVMHCANQNCKQIFCWACLGTLETHTNLICNEEIKKRHEEAREAASQLSENFYFKQYIYHKELLEWESEKLQQLKNPALWSVVWLIRPIEILVRCRIFLIHTSAFSHYIIKNNAFILFRLNRDNLLENMNQLSFLFTRALLEEDKTDFKSELLGKADHCEQRLQALENMISEGYIANSWNFDEAKV